MNLGLVSAGRRQPGVIDYRLARQRVLAAYRAGTTAGAQICDAQAELVRNATHCGRAGGEECPICAAAELVHVTYAFGPRLPAAGRCVTERSELARLARRKLPTTMYVVEVCVSCRWNHLVRSFILGGEAATR